MATKRKKSKVKTTIAVFAVIFAVTAAVFGIIIGSDRYYHSTYPLEYSGYVEMYADMNGIDKYMVYSFIRTESGFNPDSVSEVGARGLMQIMPETFEWIRYRLDEENDPDMIYDRMFDVEDNIRYGCYLLGYLSEEFGGGITEIAAAYHAGAGSVTSWLENPDYSRSGHLTDIPISDTAHYVDKIRNAYDVYNKLYNENKE